jgi:hypothetical protein
MFLSDIDSDIQTKLSSRRGPFSVFSVGGASPPEMDMPHTVSESSSATTTIQDGELLHYTHLEQSAEHHITCQSPQPAGPDLDFNMELLLSSEPTSSSFELFSAVEHTSASTSLIDQVPASEGPHSEQYSIAEANLDKTNSQDTSAVETSITPFRRECGHTHNIYTGIFQDSEIAFLMSHYDTHVASLLMPVAHSENPFRRLYLSTAIEGIMNHDSSVRTSKEMAYTALYQSLLASAAFHRWNCDQRQVHRETGAKYRYRAIQSLQNAVSNAASVANYQVLMMAILSLVTIGVSSLQFRPFCESC